MHKANYRAALLAGTVLAGLPAFPFMMEARTLDDLIAERSDLEAESQSILAAADEAGADVDETGLEKIEANAALIAKLDRQIAARQAVQATPPSAGRRSTPEPQNGPEPANPAAGSRRVPASARDTQRGGFRSLGEFALGTYYREKKIDNELARKVQAAATTYGNEGSGADGGALVPPEFANQIWTKVEAEENLLNRCAPLTVNGNSITIPKDEKSPWDTSGGVQVYWESEGAQVGASKPAFEPATMRLNKLMALVNVSDELLEDAAGLESWLQAKAPAKMVAKINTAIIAGTGVGQPLGILNAPSLISVAKETSQAADTVLFPNINKMFARMYAGWRRSAVWLINQDLESQLDGMAFDWQAESKVPVYLPAGTIANSPYGILKGRPVISLEACSAIGDQGDILFVDFNQYWALKKTQGVKQDTSIHLYFDQGLQSFRFTFRVNGQPAWSSVINRQNGANTLSWAVTLDAR